MAGDQKDSLELGVTGHFIRPNIESEFFSVGAPLHAVRAGYVKRRADDVLFDTVSSGRYAHVLAPDRSGKSSLVAATAARLEMNGCKVATLDLAQIGERDAGTDSGRWFYNVAYRLSRQFRVRQDLQEWWQEKSVLSNRQRLLEFYAEIILHHVPEQIVIFVDEIQCIDAVPDADQLLASIRSAHNARATNPDFSRLSFVLLGECDPISLVEEAEVSPFNVTQQVLLDDFTRAELDVFKTELNLDADGATIALDRIFYWTNGQPYLCQKLARAVARDAPAADVASFVDQVATQQLTGRSGLHNEPHMSHIHRGIVKDKKKKEALLNLYGKLRKGAAIPADLGSALQRRLMAVGLVTIDEDGILRVRNRLYENVFTTRWANENLPFGLKVPAIVAASILLLGLIPFWYTQWLPNPYVRILSDPQTEIATAAEAYRDLNSFPAHDDIARRFFGNYLQQRAALATDFVEISEIADHASILPESHRLADRFEAEYWDRVASSARREEDRDAALLANLQSLVLSTSKRRRSAAGLVGSDYPLLLATLSPPPQSTSIFDSEGKVLTIADGATLSQWSWTAEGIRERAPWSATALQVSPLVRRVIIDRDGFVNRAGLTLNISHSRLADLRVKIIAPSGRAVEVKPDLVEASSSVDIQISSSQLNALVGESLRGTWTISIRDEELGIAGQLVGWNLKLNSQGAVENFQRGLNIPDPLETNADSIWFDSTGRYAVARAQQSDTARIWDLTFAEPVRAIAITENDALIGMDVRSRRLVTATQDRVNVWHATSGDAVSSIALGAPSQSASLTRDGERLFVERHGTIDTTLELRSLQDGELVAKLQVAGLPAQIAIDHSGSRVAIADFDRAVRVWDFSSGDLLGQFDLPAQASEIYLSADGSTLGVVHGDAGLSVWRVASPGRPLLSRSGSGEWSLRFSPSGSRVALGKADVGYHVYSVKDGRMLGPPLGMRRQTSGKTVLEFSDDEQMLLTGGDGSEFRFWDVGDMQQLGNPAEEDVHRIWSPAADRISVTSSNGETIAIGDDTGHVHIVAASVATGETSSLRDELSYLGHGAPVVKLAFGAENKRVVSAAEDNSVRVWDAESGEPLAFEVVMGGSRISQLQTSPDAKTVAIVNDGGLALMSLENGDIEAEFALPGIQSGLAFTRNGDIFIGNESGAINKVGRLTDGSWQMHQVWQGETSIKMLQVTQRDTALLIVDDQNIARQMLLAQGHFVGEPLLFPSAIEEVVIGPHGNSVYFRTARWVHKASASAAGLFWLDAQHVPPALAGSGLVFANSDNNASLPLQVLLPTAVDGELALTEVRFSSSPKAGLLGTKDELHDEWQQRISAPRRAAF